MNPANSPNRMAAFVCLSGNCVSLYAVGASDSDRRGWASMTRSAFPAHPYCVGARPTRLGSP